MTRRPRAGFTLVEMIVVVAILGVVAGVSVPALRDRRAADPLEQAASEMTTLLSRVRRTAVERAMPVRLSVDPVSHRWRARTLASAAATDSVAVDSLPLPAGMELGDGERRTVITFTPTGEARGDTVVLRWQGRTAAIVVDQWTGDAHVAAH